MRSSASATGRGRCRARLLCGCASRRDAGGYLITLFTVEGGVTDDAPPAAASSDLTALGPVGTRDQAKLVEGVHKQVDLVLAVLDAAGLADVPVRGVLCFVEADWPLLGGSFAIGGVDVLWPKKAAEHLLTPGGLDDAMAEQVHRTLAGAFPAA